MTAKFPTKRMRRLRWQPVLRDMLAETRLSLDDFVSPLFVCAGENRRTEIPSMPGQFQYSVDMAVETVRRWAGKGLRAILLFGIPESKDAAGSTAWSTAAPVQRLCGEVKKALPELLVITDVCLCEYTDHGHCGPVRETPDGRSEVDNDAALDALARTAISHVRAGADIVAPSAMMDGQVAAIRAALDEAAFIHTPILAYAVKFASAFYGPFRDAAASAPQFGDRRSYQMDYQACRQAIDEATADLDEGADILMVKPAGIYLDVLVELRRRFDAPLAAYQVSGEYAMLKAAARNGWLNERAAVIESLTAVKRAGADIIITYFAEQLTDWL